MKIAELICSHAGGSAGEKAKIISVCEKTYIQTNINLPGRSLACQFPFYVYNWRGERGKSGKDYLRSLFVKLKRSGWAFF